MLSVRVGNAPAALRAAVVAMRAADKEIRSGVSQRMRGTMSPVWKSEVGQGASGLAARLLTPGTRIAAGNPPALVAASGNRKIGRGLTPNLHAAGFEFGAGDGVRTQRSGRGPNRSYSRHVMRHLPARNRDGRVVFPAAGRVLPRVASYWAQSVIRAFLDAAEGTE